MFEALTTEMLLTVITVIVSASATSGALWALRATQQRKHEDCDIDAAVRNAPYHRLHNIVPDIGG